MLTCGLKADAYLTTQAMKSHLDQVGGCVVSSIVKRAVGTGHLPCPQLCWMQAGAPYRQGGCSWSSSGGQPLAPCAKRKARAELAPTFPPKLPTREAPPTQMWCKSRGKESRSVAVGSFLYPETCHTWGRDTALPSPGLHTFTH